MVEGREESRFGVVRQGLDAPEPATSTRRVRVCVRSCVAANENERTRVYDLGSALVCVCVCVSCSVCARRPTLSYESRRMSATFYAVRRPFSRIEAPARSPSPVERLPRPPPLLSCRWCRLVNRVCAYLRRRER